MDGIFVTSHARMRMRQRMRLNKYSQCAEKAATALSEGLDPSTDPVLAEILRVKLKEWPNSTFRVLAGVVFVFKKRALVTVYPLAWANTFQPIASGE